MEHACIQSGGKQIICSCDGMDVTSKVQVELNTVKSDEISSCASKLN